MKHRGFETDAKKVNPTRSTTALPKTASPDTQLQNLQNGVESGILQNVVDLCRSGIRRAF